jgi:hypothetical protein
MRYRALCHTNQRYLYCRKATANEALVYGANGFPGIEYVHTERLGINQIGNFLPKLCAAAGIRKKTNHSLRGYTITKAVNNPNVNQVEVANLAGHKSVASQTAYIRPNADSEIARVKALMPSDFGTSLASTLDVKPAFVPPPSNYYAYGPALFPPVPPFASATYPHVLPFASAPSATNNYGYGAAPYPRVLPFASAPAATNNYGYGAAPFPPPSAESNEDKYASF